MTYVHVESGQWKDPGRRLLFGDVSVELGVLPIPLDRVEGRALQVVIAHQSDRVALPDGHRDVQAHPLQAPTAADPWNNAELSGSPLRPLQAAE